MANIPTTSPELKVVKNFFDAYISLDINNVEAHIAKDYKFETFPKIDHLPDESKKEHFERYGKLLTLIAKLEVRIHQYEEHPSSPLADIYDP
jgi:hypothetical protein